MNKLLKHMAWMNRKTITLSEIVSLKGYIDYDSIYKTFSERQNYNDEQSNCFREVRVGEECDYKGTAQNGLGGGDGTLMYPDCSGGNTDL